MRVTKIRRGVKVQAGKKYTWVEKVIVWCEQCQEERTYTVKDGAVFHPIPHRKNVIFVCGRCGDSVTVQLDRLRDIRIPVGMDDH